VIVYLFVATFRKNFGMDLHEIFKGWQWANEQMIKFWWRSGSRIWIWIRICTRLCGGMHCQHSFCFC